MPPKDNKINSKMVKSKISQDTLYEYLKEHGISDSCIARHMGVRQCHVNSTFLHHKDNFGVPRKFSERMLPKLNNALWSIADELRQSVIEFGTDQMETNRLGTTYDPGTIPAIKNLSNYLNLTHLCKRVLGWSKERKDATLSGPSTKRYGHISADDVARINAELLSVAGMLSGIEVVADDNLIAPAAPSANNTKPTNEGIELAPFLKSASEPELISESKPYQDNNVTIEIKRDGTLTNTTGKAVNDFSDADILLYEEQLLAQDS